MQTTIDNPTTSTKAPIKGDFKKPMDNTNKAKAKIKAKAKTTNNGTPTAKASGTPGPAKPVFLNGVKIDPGKGPVQANQDYSNAMKGFKPGESFNFKMADGQVVKGQGGSNEQRWVQSYTSGIVQQMSHEDALAKANKNWGQLGNSEDMAKKAKTRAVARQMNINKTRGDLKQATPTNTTKSQPNTTRWESPQTPANP